MGDNNSSNLPPGFRFYPSDEELVVHFLQRRPTLLPCHPDIIPDLDLFPYDPWHLHGKALCEGRKWYYYSRRTQSRVSESGYWKAMGVDEPIFSASNGKKVGMKKYFMFYIGDPSSSDGGSWTNWIMHEYRLSDSSSSSSRKSRSRSNDHSRWVVCKVYEQAEGDDDDDDNDGTELSCLDEVFLSMDDYDEISLPS
ncbi:hypothetical protein V2J09_018788 [Rumex salicifolius]